MIIRLTYSLKTVALLTYRISFGTAVDRLGRGY